MNENNNQQNNLPQEPPKLDPETDRIVKAAVQRTVEEYGEALKKMGNE